MSRFFLSFHYSILPILVFLILPGVSISQTGPGGVDLADKDAHLELWIDADHSNSIDTGKADPQIGKLITGIRDRSGKKRVVALSDTNSNNILFLNSNQGNGFGRIGFNKNLLTEKVSGLVIDSFYKSSDFTAYLVLEPSSQNTKVVQTILAFNDTSRAQSSAINTFHLELGNNQLSWKGAPLFTQGNFAATVPVEPEKTYIVRVSNRAMNGAFEIMLNNGQAKSVISDKPLFDGVLTSTIGYSRKEDGYQGFIYSIIVFSRMLNSAERVLVENYLSAKYNIPIASGDFYGNDSPENGNYDIDVAGIGKAADGSFVMDAKGEGIMEIRNPSHLGSNEFLIWGRNKVDFKAVDSVDIPRNISFRLATTWRCSEIGEVGKIDMLIDTAAFRLPQNFKLVLLVDRNQSGTFADDTIQTFLQGNGLNKQRALTQIQLNNGDRFTLGVIKDYSQWTSGIMTPNGDGMDDTYYVQRQGMVRILNQNGNLVRELKAPAAWDGKNNDGQLVSPGGYTLEINRQERISISVRY